MKFLSRAWLVGALWLLAGHPALAYQLDLFPMSPRDVTYGDIVSFDVYLDTQGASGISFISASFTYDPVYVMYRPDLSLAEDYYPLYAPAAGKGLEPTWLEPVANPPAEWAGTPPPIGGQVNVEFAEVSGFGTTATATHLFLATLSFEILPGGEPGGVEGFVSDGEWGFGHGGNAFIVDGVDVAGTEAFANGDAWIVVIPEPTTALLVGIGLAGLGIAARARR